MSALERIGEGLVSFGTGIPRVELEARRLANEQREVNLEATQNDLEAQRQEAERQAEIRRLMQVVVDGGEGLGLQKSDRMEEAARFAVMLRNTPFEQRRPLILSRAAEIESSGDQFRNANDTLSLLDMDEQTQNSRLRVIEMLPLTAQQRLNVERGAGLSADARSLDAQIRRFNELDAIPENERTEAQKNEHSALAVELRLAPGAGTTSARERIAESPEATQSVAESSSTISQAESVGRGTAARITEQINQGVSAADALPTLRRTKELLELVETGGAINQAGLSFARTFGIETADQGELSALLGKAVLSQLRETFGPQFTQAEGERLEEIEAGFGQSNATNLRLINNAISIFETKAKRAADLARANGDEATAVLIEQAMEQVLGSEIPEGTIIRATDGSNRRMILQDGEWVEL